MKEKVNKENTKIISLIPNLLTTMALSFGLLSIFNIIKLLPLTNERFVGIETQFLTEKALWWSCIFIYIAAFIDFVDGKIAKLLKKNSPNAFVICITNPLDVIVIALQKYSGLPTNKIVGMAGILDSSRFKYFLSQELRVPVKSINTLVLGGHGDTMVPMPNQTSVNGKSLKQLVEENKINKERLDLIIDRTRKGGAEIVKFLEKGSAFYAPAASGVEMAESYIKDLKKTLPCAAYLDGEYGVKNLYAGVPVIIGNKGVEKVVELPLDKNEKTNFDLSIKAVKKLFEAAVKIDKDLAN